MFKLRQVVCSWVGLTNVSSNERAILIDHHDNIPPAEAEIKVNGRDLHIQRHVMKDAVPEGFSGVLSVHAVFDDSVVTRSWSGNA